MEHKEFNFGFEIDENEPLGTIKGYGSVFGNVDCYGDIVEKGAFIKSIDTNKENNFNVPILWQHDTTKPIGVWEEISEDEHGLKMKGRLLIDDVQQAKEAYALLKANAIKGLSIGYTTEECFYDTEKCRRLKELKLYEVSLVTFPANDKANITSVKSEELSIRDAEKALIRAGFSQKLAKTILSKGYKSALNRDDLTDQRDVEKQALESMKSLKNIFN